MPLEFYDRGVDEMLLNVQLSFSYILDVTYLNIIFSFSFVWHLRTHVCAYAENRIVREKKLEQRKRTKKLQSPLLPANHRNFQVNRRFFLEKVAE